jgi:hypothetical protein
MTKTSLLRSDINALENARKENRSVQSTTEAALLVHRFAAMKD